MQQLFYKDYCKAILILLYRLWVHKISVSDKKKFICKFRLVNRTHKGFAPGYYQRPFSAPNISCIDDHINCTPKSFFRTVLLSQSIVLQFSKGVQTKLGNQRELIGKITVCCHLSKLYMIQKDKINNWILQFLKNETKAFLILQKICYSLYI